MERQTTKMSIHTTEEHGSNTQMGINWTGNLLVCTNTSNITWY